MRKYSVLLPLAVMAFLPLGSIAAEKVVAQATPDLSLRVEVENSIGKGLTWLAGKQNPEGYWAQSEHPAVTALILTAFQGDPSKFYQRSTRRTSRRAMTIWPPTSSLTAASTARACQTTTPRFR